MLRNIVASHAEHAQQHVEVSPASDADEFALLFLSFAVLYQSDEGGGLLTSGKIGYAGTGDAAGDACANAYIEDMQEALRAAIAAQGVTDAQFAVGLPQWPYAAMHNGATLANVAASSAALDDLPGGCRSARIARLSPVIGAKSRIRVVVVDEAGRDRSFVWFGRNDLEASVDEISARLSRLGVTTVDVSALDEMRPRFGEARH